VRVNLKRAGTPTGEKRVSNAKARTDVVGKKYFEGNGVRGRFVEHECGQGALESKVKRGAESKKGNQREDVRGGYASEGTTPEPNLGVYRGEDPRIDM